MDERRRLNLDDLQPEGIVLTFGGTDYDLPGEVPLPTVVRLLRFQEKLEAAGGDTSKIADALEAVVEDIMSLIRVNHPDVETLDLSVGAVVQIVNFLVAGQNVDATVTRASAPDDEGEADDAPPLAHAS